MSRDSKALIGVISFIPFILAMVMMIMLINLIPHFFEWDKQEPEFYTVYSTITPIIITAIICGIISLGLLIFFIINMMNNKKMESVEKLIWIIVFLCFGFIGYPIYWYMRVWKEQV